MANLRQEHPMLYRRLAHKVILFLGFGISLRFFSPEYTPNAQGTVMEKFASLHVHGMIFLAIGIMLIIGLYRSRNEYNIARYALFVAGGYNLMWLVALCANIFKNPGSLAVILLWAYLTNNIFLVANDPGWETVQILKNGNGNAVPGR